MQRQPQRHLFLMLTFKLVTRCVLTCCKCCLCCLEKFLKFLNYNAYIICSMKVVTLLKKNLSFSSNVLLLQWSENAKSLKFKVIYLKTFTWSFLLMFSETQTDLLFWTYICSIIGWLFRVQTSVTQLTSLTTCSWGTLSG